MVVDLPEAHGVVVVVVVDVVVVGVGYNWKNLIGATAL